MNLKILLFLIILTGFSTSLYSQTVPVNALEVLEGEGWKGKLTYLDYSSNENVTIPVEMKVNIPRKGTYQIAYFYPDEPSANSKAKVKIKNDGTKIAGNKVTQVETTETGLMIIHAESKGSDNNEKAMLYFTYTIGKNYFSSKKEVSFAENEKLILRNKYELRR